MYNNSNEHKIPYDDIKCFYLLPTTDDRSLLLFRLSKAISRGTKRFPFLLLQTTSLPTEIQLNLTEEQLNEEPFKGNLQATMTGPLGRVIAKIFKSISQKPVYTHSEYKNQHGFAFCRCALKANNGQLYPLQRGILFVHSPTVLYSYDEIKSIQYERYEDRVSTTIDLKITLRSGRADGLKEVTFSSIDRKEATNLTAFFTAKKNLNFIAPKEEDNLMQLDDDDDEEDDESYNAEESDDDDDSDDSDDDDDDSDESDESDKKATKKRKAPAKKNTTAKRTKTSSAKKKQESDDDDDDDDEDDDDDGSEDESEDYNDLDD